MSVKVYSHEMRFLRCGECGIPFCIPEAYAEAHCFAGKPATCPQGHQVTMRDIGTNVANVAEKLIEAQGTIESLCKREVNLRGQITRLKNQKRGGSR